MTRQSVRSPGLCHLHTPFASYDDDDDDDDDDDVYYDGDCDDDYDPTFGPASNI